MRSAKIFLKNAIYLTMTSAITNCLFAPSPPSLHMGLNKHSVTDKRNHYESYYKDDNSNHITPNFWVC